MRLRGWVRKRRRQIHRRSYARAMTRARNKRRSFVLVATALVPLSTTRLLRWPWRRLRYRDESEIRLVHFSSKGREHSPNCIEGRLVRVRLAAIALHGEPA